MTSLLTEEQTKLVKECQNAYYDLPTYTDEELKIVELLEIIDLQNKVIEK